MRRREKELHPSAKIETRIKGEAAEPRKALLRVGVRSAAYDIKYIFDYIRGRREGNSHGLQQSSLAPGARAKGLCELENAALDDDIVRIGFLSPLYHIGGSVQIRGQGEPRDVRTEVGNLPLAEFYIRAVSKNGNTSLRKNLRLLLLAEQAFLSSFINYRDSIPDYGYAASVLATAEMYIISLYLLGTEGLRTKELGELRSPEDQRYYSKAFRMITATAKRYIVKAIDTLKRERDQNRNTFHLMSEAHFNLGDLLLIRLAALRGRESGVNLCEQLFGFSFVEPAEVVLEDESDRHPEDLKRQIWEHYRDGIILVQSEMDELFGRYRFPPDVFHAHRNVMDPVLHHRICKAARTRHAATRPHKAQKPRRGGSAAATGFDPAKFDKIWEDLSQIITNYVSPSLPDNDWLEEMKPILDAVNSVRSDRGPLKIVSPKVGRSYRINWIDSAELDQLNQMVLFFESYRPDSEDEAKE
jgi:hypothetical protein